MSDHSDPPVENDDTAVETAPTARRWPILAAVAVGGLVGAEIRFVLGLLYPAAPGEWPWATFVINVTGCLLIGVLLTVLGELTTPHRLVRPLLGVGVLGGYTTFSTYAVDAVGLVDAGRVGTAVGYAVATPVTAILACAFGIAITRRFAGRAPVTPVEQS